MTRNAQAETRRCALVFMYRSDMAGSGVFSKSGVSVCVWR